MRFVVFSFVICSFWCIIKNMRKQFTSAWKVITGGYCTVEVPSFKNNNKFVPLLNDDPMRSDLDRIKFAYQQIARINFKYLGKKIQENPNPRVSNFLIKKFIENVSLGSYAPVWKNGEWVPYDEDSQYAWCAAYVSDVLQNVEALLNFFEIPTLHYGLKKTGVAKKLFNSLHPVKYPCYFDVVLLERNGKHHVGFFLGVKGEKITLLGGNQNDSLNITRYPRSRYKIKFACPIGRQGTKAEQNSINKFMKKELRKYKW